MSKGILLGAACLVAGALLTAVGFAVGGTWRAGGITLILLSLVLIGSAMVGGKGKGAHR